MVMNYDSNYWLRVLALAHDQVRQRQCRYVSASVSNCVSALVTVLIYKILLCI